MSWYFTLLSLASSSDAGALCEIREVAVRFRSVWKSDVDLALEGSTLSGAGCCLCLDKAVRRGEWRRPSVVSGIETSAILADTSHVGFQLAILNTVPCGHRLYFQGLKE